MSLSLNKISNNILGRFTKKTVPIPSDVLATKAKAALGDTFNHLADAVTTKAPEYIDNSSGLSLPRKEKFSKKLIEAGRDFFEIPFDFLNEYASSHPKSRLNNAKFLKNYREHHLKENQIKAFQGAFEDVASLMEKAKANGEKISNEKLTEEFDELFRKAINPEESIYDTKKERFCTRLISGLTAAAFLGSDYFNSAKLKGKTDDEANAAKGKKQAQEVKECFMEGFAAYLLAACVPKFVNNNIWGSVFFSTGVSLIARVLSRKMSGMPLQRVKVPDNSMNEFIKSVKENTQYETQSEKDKKAKKPVLSLKNILLFFGATIVAGFALSAGSRTKVGKPLYEKLKDYMVKRNDKFISSVHASKGDLDKIVNILKNCGEADYADRIAGKLEGTGDRVYLGSRYTTKKLFGKVEVKVKDLKNLPFAPFKMISSIITYPYKKIAKPFAKACGFLDKESDSIAKVMSESIKDDYGIKDLYLMFKKYEKQFGDDPAKLSEEFGKFIQDARLASLNNVTSSKVDNSKIAVMAQTAGTMTGLWFNMNDEFNASIKNGEDKQSAEKAARKRGLNKFTRMSVQNVISGTLNSLFKLQYQGGFIGAALVVAASTFLTDKVARLLTAMPTKKMNSKEEIQRYQDNSKNGKMAWYHKGIDKLAS